MLDGLRTDNQSSEILETSQTVCHSFKQPADRTALLGCSDHHLGIQKSSKSLHHLVLRLSNFLNDSSTSQPWHPGCNSIIGLSMGADDIATCHWHLSARPMMVGMVYGRFPTWMILWEYCVFFFRLAKVGIYCGYE